jgi:6-phosphogluconolactonase (cycloisomerase 2 family)
MPNPAQVGFSPDGRVLIVTEKSTQLIDMYAVSADGRAGDGVTSPSVGIEPFGFAFDPAGHVLVSEAFNGGPGRSAVSSYQANGTDLNVISPSVGTTQTAACWVVVSPDGQTAFVTNTGSGTVSSYDIAGDGSIALAQAVAGNSGPHSGPTDVDLSDDGQFAYVLDSGFGTISGYEVAGADLSNMRMFGSLPPGATGLAAR